MISRHQATLVDTLTNRTFRFISYNVPNLHVIEKDTLVLPVEYEQDDAAQSIAIMKGNTIRIYSLTIEKKGDLRQKHISFETSTRKLVFHEPSFVALDQAIASCAKFNIKLIIPLIDNWEWMGGLSSFAAFYGKPRNFFFLDPEVKSAFKQVISFLLERNNTITGVLYKEDPTILAWETGNELEGGQGDLISYEAGTGGSERVPTEWTKEMVSYIKSIDKNHLVFDGQFNTRGWDPQILADPSIDGFSGHYYAGLRTNNIHQRVPVIATLSVVLALGLLGLIWITLKVKRLRSPNETENSSSDQQKKKPLRISSHKLIFPILLFLVVGSIVGLICVCLLLKDGYLDTLSLAQADAELVIGQYQKVFFIGEYGLDSNENLVKLIKLASDWKSKDQKSQFSGALAWSLRFRSRNGGFYTHSEGNNFNSYHLPGCVDNYSPETGFSDESLTSIIRDYAFKVNGLDPNESTLRLTSKPAIISLNAVAGNKTSLQFKGCAGANRYLLEKEANDKSIKIVDDISECVPDGQLSISIPSEKSRGNYRIVGYFQNSKGVIEAYCPASDLYTIR